MSDWDTLKQYLHQRVLYIIEKLNYRKPTAIQAKAIPIISASTKNILIIAPTGSGKTEAVIFPVISIILKNRSRYGRPSILYITPLRALNRDLKHRLEYIFEASALTMAIWHGDTSYKVRKKISEKPPDMIITTPESLQYILVNKALRETLRNVRFVIIDEVHELLDSERGCELSCGIERLKKIANDRLRIFGLSGTISDPFKAAEFIAGRVGLVEIINVSGYKRYHIDVKTPYSKYESMKKHDLKDVVLKPGEGYSYDRVGLLIDEIKNSNGSILIFTNTRDQAEMLGAALKKLNIATGVHHGSLSRTERENVENLFRNKELKAVIATSSLELGIDIGHIDKVIQYQSPRQVTKLIQRVGRSGHTENQVSKGTIITTENIYEVLESHVIARRARDKDLARNLEKLKINIKPIDVLIHQILGLALEYGEIDIDTIISILTKSICFRDLTSEDVNRTIDFMENIKLIRKSKSTRTIKATKRGEIYYYTTTSIVDTRNYIAIDTASNKVIGELDEEFVVKKLFRNPYIVLGGRIWRVIGIEDEKLYLEQAKIEDPIIPSWIGQQIPVSKSISEEVCYILREISSDGDKNALRKYNIDPSTLSIIKKTVDLHISRGYIVPDKNNIVIESWSEHSGINTIVIHACIGLKGNEALGLYLSGVMSNKQLVYSATPYGLILGAYPNIDARTIADYLYLALDKDEEWLQNIIRIAAKQSNTFKWYMVSVGKKMGIIDKNVSYLDAMNYIKFWLDTLVEEEAYREMLHEEIDVDAFTSLLDKLRKGKAKIHIYNSVEPSPLSKELYLLTSNLERIKTQSIPQDLLVELIRKRLEEKKCVMVCINCGYIYEKVVKELDEKPSCPRCTSILVGPYKYRDGELEKAIKKYIKSPSIINNPKALSDKEKAIINEVRRSVELVVNYGKKAIITMMGRGIGTDTASKILSTAYSDKDLFMKIYEAEKRYIATRRFWD